MRIKNVFIAALAFVLLLFPNHGSASVKTIAAVLSSDQPRYREAHRAFVKSLEARGYGRGKTEIILQSPNPDAVSWSNTIRKFNAYKPDLIMAYGAGASLVALQETDNIPVVSADIYALEKVAKGVCGVSSRVPMMTLVKSMQMIHPYRTIGVIYTNREVGSRRQADDIRKAASQFGAKTIESNVTSEKSLDSAISYLISKTDVIVITEGSIACRYFERIISRATARSIPVFSTMPDAAEKGALLSLEISPQEQGQLAAEIAVRILEGANPANLSLLTPHRVDLVVNMRAAHAMKINLPFQLFGSVTRVIK